MPQRWPGANNHSNLWKHWKRSKSGRRKPFQERGWRFSRTTAHPGSGRSSWTRDHALAVARFLRDDPQLRLDYASNVTGVDWLDTVIKEKVKVKQVVDGAEKEMEETVERKVPGYLEVVYHLYSMELKHGPVILRLRTQDRTKRSMSLR